MKSMALISFGETHLHWVLPSDRARWHSLQCPSIRPMLVFFKDLLVDTYATEDTLDTSFATGRPGKTCLKMIWSSESKKPFTTQTVAFAAQSSCRIMHHTSNPKKKAVVTKVARKANQDITSRLTASPSSTCSGVIFKQRLARTHKIQFYRDDL